MAQKISGPFKNYKRTLRFSTEPHFSRLYFSTEDALKLNFKPKEHSYLAPQFLIIMF